MPVCTVSVVPRATASASGRNSVYVFQCAVSAQLSDCPLQSVLPMNAIATRPRSPARTSGNTVEPTPGGWSAASLVQKEPGRPLMAGLLRLSWIGDSDMLSTPLSLTQTMYALPEESMSSHGKTSALSPLTAVECQLFGFCHPGAYAVPTITPPPPRYG